MANQNKCEPCLFGKETSTAIAFCVVCVEYLCETCNRDHQRNKMTRMHTILSNSDLPNDASAFLKMRELLLCPKHPHDKIAYRCVDHDELICITCCAVNHRTCDHIEDLANCQVNKELLSKLDGIEETVKSAKSVKTANREQLKQEREKVDTERIEFVTSLYNQIKKLDEDLQSKTDKLVTPSLLELENRISKCEEIEKEANSRKSLLEVAKKYGNKAELGLISLFVEKNIEKLDNDCQEQTACNKDCFTIKFETNPALKDVKEIGSVTFKKLTKQYQSPSYSVQTSSDEVKEVCSTSARNASAPDQASVSKPTAQGDNEPMQWKVQNISQHDIRGPGDTETCFVNALLLLSSGLLIVADRRNKKIKVFKNYFRFAYEQPIYYAPVDICQVKSLNIYKDPGCEYVASINDNDKFVKVFGICKERMTRCKEWGTKLYCLSVATFRASKILILFSEKPQSSGEGKPLQIDIRDMSDGHIVQELMVKDFFTNFYRTQTFRIHITPKNSLILSEFDKLHVLEERCFKLDKRSHKCFSYKDSEVIADIDSDEEGNVYICGKRSKNIHQVSAANYGSGRVIVFGVKDPAAICVDRKHARVIVGRENDDNIHVFHMGK